MNYFINYLFNKEEIKNTEEFRKFLNDTKFDEEFFTSADNLYDFPESSKINSSFFGVFSSVTSYFKSNNKSFEASEEDRVIKQMEEFYKLRLSSYRELKKYIVKEKIKKYLIFYFFNFLKFDNFFNNFFNRKI